MTTMRQHQPAAISPVQTSPLLPLHLLCLLHRRPLPLHLLLQVRSASTELGALLVPVLNPQPLKLHPQAHRQHPKARLPVKE